MQPSVWGLDVWALWEPLQAGPRPWALTDGPAAAGAPHLGGGTDAGRTAAEDAGGAAAAPRAGAGRAGDRHPRTGAQHHHPPAVPGEAPGEETQGQVPEEPAEAQGWKPHQPPFRWVPTGCWEVGAGQGLAWRGAGSQGLSLEKGTLRLNREPV